MREILLGAVFFHTFIITMIYRHYRYILLIKIALLIAWVFMVWQEWYIPQPTWWTLFLLPQSFSSPQRIPSFLQTESLLPQPRALLSEEAAWTVIHIPWSLDTGYISAYMQSPLPAINKNFIDRSVYTDSCKQLVTANEYWDISVSTCWSSRRSVNIVIATIFLLVWLIL